MTLIRGDGGQWEARCPGCGVKIHAQATVGAFMENPDWQFWGNVGERWRLCEGSVPGYNYIHFKVLINGRTNHRLAWMKRLTIAEATQGALL